MAKIPGTNVASTIAPFTTDDQFPTHDAIYGKGGQREVATIADRDAIPAARLTEGCTCYVAATEKTYRWKSNAWVDDTPEIASDASDIDYTPSGSGSTPTTVAGALDSLNESVSGLEDSVQGNADDIADLEEGAVAVDVNTTTKVFAIKNAKGQDVGTITVSETTGLPVTLTLAKAGTNGQSITISLPTLAYNSQTQMLEYVDATGTHVPTIKLSNLQIKYVGSTDPSTGTWALGDLILVGSNSSYELKVYDGNSTWQPIGSINNVSLVADQVEFDNSTNGFNANNVQRAIEEVAANLEGVEKDYSITEDDDSIEIEDEQGNKVVEITPNGVDAKNLKSNGKNVATEDELDLLATKEEVEGKQDEIDGIEQAEQSIQTDVIEFRDDSNNYVGEVSPQAIAAKKFLIKTSPSDAGTDITDIAGSTSIAKQFGLSDIIHVLGFGQSLMSGTNSGTPVTTTQSRSNLFRFEGGVRPYDVLNLDLKKRVHLNRLSGVNPIYLEMSDKKSECLESSDISRLNTSIGSLTPLIEQKPLYVDNGDNTYSPSNSGTTESGHKDGETPLSGFCEGLLQSLEKQYGNNFGFNMIATCCAYGSANFLSLCPLDRDGRIHNYTDSPTDDGTNMNYFELVMMSVKAAKAIADAQNKSYSVDVVVYMESNTIATQNGNSITLTNALKAYRIAQLFTLVNQRVKAITKQSNDIIFLCDQSKTYMSQREAIRILGVENEITLTTTEENTLKTLPNYDVEPYDLNKIYLALSTNNYLIGSDKIHHPSYINKIEGATIGDAYAKILSGKGFSPLYPTNFKVIGNNIYIKYNVPVSPIVIDENAVNGNQVCTDYMNGYSMYGFGISDGGTSPVYYDIITNVEVSEPDTIKITCSDIPIGKYLEYCYRPISNSGTGLPTNTEFGNIRDSQGDVTKININNTYYPLHNWAIGFMKEL